MKFIQKIITLSAAFFIAALNAQIDAPKEQMTETREDIQNKIEKLFNSFIPSQLTAQDKVLLDDLQLSITTLAKTISSEWTPEKEKRKLQVLSIFCSYEKNLRIKIELLALKIPLITEQIQHLQLQALKFLCEKVRTYCALIKNNKPDKGFKFSNQELTTHLRKIILQELPKQIEKLDKFSYIHWINNSKILAKYLKTRWNRWRTFGEILQRFSCDYSLKYSDLCNLYIKIIKQYREGTYTSLHELLKNAITQHEQARQEIEDQLLAKPLTKTKEKELHTTQTIISLFLGKLLKIKAEVLSLQPQAGEKSDPIKAILLDRYTTITVNPNLGKSLIENTEFATLYNSVQKIFSIFKTSTELQQHTVRELVSTLEKLQNFLKYNDISAIAKWTAKPDATYLLVSQMAALLENTCDYLFAKIQDPFIKELLNFSNFAPKTSKAEPVGPYQKIIIETAERITGKTFTNLKDIVLHFLSNASPSITAYFLSLVLPQIKPEAKQLLTSLFTQQDNLKKTEDPNKTEQNLIDMMNQFLASDTNAQEPLNAQELEPTA